MKIKNILNLQIKIILIIIFFQISSHTKPYVAYADSISIPPKLTGKLVYHSYSSYEARDSKIYLLDFDSKEKICLSDSFSGISNPMNACFNQDGSEITFMGIVNYPGYDEWDIFKYNLYTHELIDLTLNSNFRNEDPKYSPDGNKIIFKQGRWDFNLDDMVYDLKEINLNTYEVSNITNDMYENSMPYYSSDGNSIYYSRGAGNYSHIYKVKRDLPNSTSQIFASENIKAYYPITFNNYLYFTKWYSSNNECDVIVRLNLNTNEMTTLPFNNPDFNCSDPYPISDNFLIMSSTKFDTKGCYDLYIANSYTGETWPLDIYIYGVNDANHQLGVSCHVNIIE